MGHTFDELHGTRTIARLIHRITPLLDIYIQCNKLYIQVASRAVKGFIKLDLWS